MKLLDRGPWIAGRAFIAIALPVLVALLAGSLGLLPMVDGLALPLEFLAAGPFPYAAKVVGFVVLVLVVASFFARRRTGAMLVGIAFVALTTAGFNYTRLRWTEVFGLPATYDPGAPPALAWTWAVLILASVATFLLVETMLDTRRAQEARKLPQDETLALARVSTRALVVTLVGGLAVAGVLAALAEALEPLLLAPGALPRLDPVVLLLGLGLILVLAVVLAARRRSLAAKPP